MKGKPISQNKGKKASMKGAASVVSAVLIMLVSVVAISIVLLVGIPALDSARESSLVNEAQGNMLILDNAVRQAASEGSGIVKEARLAITGGAYRANPEAGTIEYELPLESNLLARGVYRQDGNLATSVGGAASATQNSTHLIISNDILEMVFLKVGSESSFASIDTGGLIRTIRFKDGSAAISPNDTSIKVGNLTATSSGTGYTKLAREGSVLPKADVLAHVRSSQGLEYEVLYSLRGSADFLTVDVLNTSSNRTTITYTYMIGSNSSDRLRIGDNLASVLFSNGSSSSVLFGSVVRVLVDNTNHTKNSSSITLPVGDASQVLYNASDGSLRDVRELLGIGQGDWNYTSNSTHTVVNFTLAGSDGFEYGVRDSRPGGSYWLDENGSLYGMVNVSNDFIRVGMTERNLTVYNSSGKAIFNASFDGAVKIDNQNLISLYGTGTQNKTVYFYDWARQDWKMWQKGYEDITATGGNITYVNGYTVHTFISNGTFEVMSGSGEVEYLTVGGGGSSGLRVSNLRGGGGGGGGFVNGTFNVSSTSYPVVIGSGGACCTNDGGDSIVFGVTAGGGGAGGTNGGAGNNGRNSGGSGGGGVYSGSSGGSGNGTGKNGGTGSTGSPFTDQNGAGGGGAGSSGQAGGTGTSGSGGDGLQSDISGSVVWYSGGGAGDPGNAQTGGSAGQGGGNTNYGGGASGYQTSGGNGVVIIKYKTSQLIGVPDWLDPRNKQAFKWRYALSYGNGTNKSSGGPNVNITFLMTAHDPFVRALVDAHPRGTVFQDDFGSNRWAFSGSGYSYDSANQRVSLATTGSSSLNQAMTDLGNISDIWELRFKLRVDTKRDYSSGGHAHQAWFGIFSDSAHLYSGNAPDFLGFTYSTNPTYYNAWYCDSTSGCNPQANSSYRFTTAPASSTTLYVKMQRTSQNSFTVSLYSNADYTTLIESQVVPVPTNVRNLRFLALGWGWSASGYVSGSGGLDGHVDDVQFWNDVGNATSGQGNVTFPVSLPENRTSVTTAETGLVRYWNLNDGSSINFTDSSGNGNMGRVNNASWISNSTCKFGNCLDFDGGFDYITVPDMVWTSSTDRSIVMWVYPQEDVNEFNLFQNHAPICSANDLINRGGTDGAGKVQYGTSKCEVGSSSTTSKNALIQNRWNMVYFIYDQNGSGCSVGVNNEIITWDASNCRDGNNGNLNFEFGGGTANVASFLGKIDEIRIYDRLLTNSEIQQLYLTGLNQQKPGIYFASNNASSEEVLFAATNWKNVNHSGFANGTRFNLFSNHTNFFGFNWTFNSTQNQNLMFALGTMGRMNTTVFNPANNASAFSSESMESVANSTLTQYDLGGITAVGGTVTHWNGYVIHTFTSNGTFNVTSGRGKVEYLVIGGGGGGGGPLGGGGGAGGYLTGAVEKGVGTYTVTVGAGGEGHWNDERGDNGRNSTFDDIVAIGGGGGDASNNAGGKNGGSGGGGQQLGAGGSGTVGQGNRGGNGHSQAYPNMACGGGGGAGGPGQDAAATDGGDGGAGLTSSINGTPVARAGGGGGCVGGLGQAGGGNGGTSYAPGTGTDATNGTANSGSGGGGGRVNGGIPALLGGGGGGSGIVIVRYLNATPWNVSDLGSGIVRHSSAYSFSYDGGAQGIWRFDEGFGLNATDSSGNGLTGFINGATWVSNSSCKQGSCLNFNPGATVTDKVQMSSPVVTGTGDFTIESWIYPRSGSPAVIMGNSGSGATALQMAVSPTAGNVNLYVTTDLYAYTAIPTSAWTHVVGVRSGGTARIYVNGVKITEATRTANIPGTLNWAVGNGPDYTSDKFVGMIDEPRIYRRALTDTEIREHYQRGITRYYDDFGTAVSGKTYRYFGVEDSNTTLQPVTPSGTGLHYRFNGNSTANAMDSSGSGNNASVSGAVWMANGSCRDGFGGCVKFDGSNDYLRIDGPKSHLTFLHGTNAKWTFSFWMKKDVTGSGINQVMFDNNNRGNGDSIGLNLMLGSGTNMNAELRCGTGCTISSGALQNVLGLNDLEWHHFTVTYDQSLASSNLKLYKDGTLNGTLNKNNDNNVNTESTTVATIGQGSDLTNIYPFNGKFDEYIIINRSLSADEVYQLYLGGSNRTVNGRWHRVASADGLQSVAFNLTDHNNTFEGADYDMRALTVNGSYVGVSVTPPAPEPGCYGIANVTRPYACSYDDSEFPQVKASGIVDAGRAQDFSSICFEGAQNGALYKFNLTSTGPLKAIIPFSDGDCSTIGNGTSTIFSQGIAATPFGSYVTGGLATLQMVLQYDRIKIVGDLRMGPGLEKACFRKIGQDGARILINATNC